MSRVKEDLRAQFAELVGELIQWRAEHPQASLDKLAAQLTPRRRELMGSLLAELAVQPGNGYVLEGLTCARGMVESACKVVVQARLGQAGMRWSRAGVQAMLTLRCTLLSDRWDATWQSLCPKLT